IVGDVAPVLRAGDASIDLALHVDQSWLTFGHAERTIAYEGPLSVFAEMSRDKVVALDAGSGDVVLVQAGRAQRVLELVRPPDVGRARFTLARRLDHDAVAVVGYSTSSGDVVAGGLDLGRGEVGPLVSIGSLDALASADACAHDKPTHRFIAEIPIALVL